jgi:hypothetical protein
LDVEGEARGDSIGIDLRRISAIGFQEDLVSLLICEAHHLIFDGGTIAGADPFDDPAVKRRPIETALDDLVRGRIGVGDIARDLVEFDLSG